MNATQAGSVQNLADDKSAYPFALPAEILNALF